MGERRTAYKSFLEGPEREIPLSRFRQICEDNTEMYHKETGLENLGWMHVAQERKT
jgi:hypothetical protein